MVLNKDDNITEEALQIALEKEEFILYFQPKIDLFTGKIVGAEALIRWLDPDIGVISPDQFIPLAESTGLILPIGEWVIRTACMQIKAWQDMGISSMFMSVNLSVHQLYQSKLVEMVQHILQETGLDAQYLDFEITESIMMDTTRGLSTIKALKQLGISISLDDFGTGYSSLRYLIEFPIDKIKIDQSFISQSLSDLNDRTIVKTIITMAHQLGIDVVAEGIELKDHLIFLQQHLCNQGQGYLFSRPLPPDDFIKQYHYVEQIVQKEGIPKEVHYHMMMNEALESVCQDLLEAVRHQQGLIFKFIKEDGKFIHTLCDGELLYRMGLTPEQIIGQGLEEFLEGKQRDIVQQYYHIAWENGEYTTYEGNINGIWYLAMLRPIHRGGQVIAVIGSCIDITKMKKVEKNLRKSELKYRLISENSQDLIRIVNPNGVVEYASPSHEKILGFPVTTFEGTAFFDMVHPDDLPNIQSQFQCTILNKTSYQVELRYKHASGNWVYVEASGNPVLDKNNNVEHLVVVARDISERKKRQELIRKSENMEVISRLAASVAHEIRNPLTTIKGFIQLLEKKSNDYPWYIETILSEIHVIEDIIEMLITFSNLESVDSQKENINLLINQVLHDFDPNNNMEHIHIIQDYDKNFPDIPCDPKRIKLAFMHIIQNAMDAMPEGGIVRIKTCRYDSNYLEIQFIDQGKGIPSERVDMIGLPIYNVKENGTGLGLLISHKIIQEHGGIIDIKSEVDQGTTVTLILPMSKHVGGSSAHEESPPCLHRR